MHLSKKEPHIEIQLKKIHVTFGDIFMGQTIFLGTPHIHHLGTLSSILRKLDAHTSEMKCIHDAGVGGHSFGKKVSKKHCTTSSVFFNFVDPFISVIFFSIKNWKTFKFKLAYSKFNSRVEGWTDTEMLSVFMRER